MRNWVSFFRQRLIRMGRQPLTELLAHAGVHIEEAQSSLAVGTAPCHFRIAFHLNVAVGKFKGEVRQCSRGKRLRREYVHPSTAHIEQNPFYVLSCLGAERYGRLHRNPKRLPPFPLQQGSRGAQGSLRLIVRDGLDEDEVSAGPENRADLGCLR